ncbi:MAG TPA: XDD4 family exosortase-dependent surface protein [Verrucomicrobiae bacterium]|nr:XDD4 family exosortase-dependent surface protein [Verrucomicrobiae bacterium]
MGIQPVVWGISAASVGSATEPSIAVPVWSNTLLMRGLRKCRQSVWMCVAMLMWAVMLMAALTILATSAQSATTYIASSPGNDAGETNKASATFSLSLSGTTTNLLVSLTNLAKYKPNDPQDILTAVFFSLTGDPTLTKVSALLNAGSVGVKNGSTLTVPGGVVGGSWAYAAGLSGAPGGANEGISAAGFGLFGSANLFPGAALPGDGSTPGGLGGGLTTATDDGSKYKGGLTGRPFIKDSAVFTLGAVPASFTLSGISGVSFQYGTTLGTEPNLPGILIPEPSAVMLAILGIVLLGLINRQRRAHSRRRSVCAVTVNHRTGVE